MKLGKALDPETPTSGPLALMGWGQVRHTRHRPAHHAFAYPTAFLMLPMRSLRQAAWVEPAPAAPQNIREQGLAPTEAGAKPIGERGLENPQTPQWERAPARESANDPQTPQWERAPARESSAEALAINKPAWFAFHDVDHGDGRTPEQGGALAWLEELLQHEGIHDAQGEVWLQAFPRVLGHTFKPVSFWYAHRMDGSLAAIVAEVNNTFGERHCYLLPSPNYGRSLRADKVFHVSPFCDVQGEYRFRFMRTQCDGTERIVARVEHADAQGPLIDTSWSGVLEPITAAALRRVMWRYPLLTLGVVARIHWHALLLWTKKVPFWRKPEPPQEFVTR